jgi:hypothetical protein
MSFQGAESANPGDNVAPPLSQIPTAIDTNSLACFAGADVARPRSSDLDRPHSCAADRASIGLPRNALS